MGGAGGEADVTYSWVQEWAEEEDMLWLHTESSNGVC